MFKIETSPSLLPLPSLPPSSPPLPSLSPSLSPPLPSLSPSPSLSPLLPSLPPPSPPLLPHRGRFSKVKLAKSKSSPQALHALKIFEKGSTTEDQFYRELCIGARMKHKNLVGYLTGLQQQNSISITME